MDEWVNVDRIISPPSIAAAEVRAQSEAKLKREGDSKPGEGVAEVQ